MDYYKKRCIEFYYVYDRLLQRKRQVVLRRACAAGRQDRRIHAHSGAGHHQPVSTHLFYACMIEDGFGCLRILIDL